MFSYFANLRIFKIALHIIERGLDCFLTHTTMDQRESFNQFCKEKFLE